MDAGFSRTALSVTAGLLIWAADFLFIYVFAALACARGFSHATLLGLGIVPLASIVATLIAGTASVAVIAAGARRAGAAGDQAPALVFLGRLAMIVATLALIAVAFVGLPGVLVREIC